MLRMTDVQKIFNKGTINEKIVLNKFNFHLKEQDFVTVIGGNGAGKSTMLNLVAGVFSCDAGNIFLNGNNITKDPEHIRAKNLGRVFQDPMMGTASNMGIEENLAMAFRRNKKRSLSWGISNIEREKYVEYLKILDLGLETRLTTKVGLLSGGQRQALTLLMATLQKPKLLLLDEHTAALDPKTAKKVLEITEEIVQREQLSTLMVTHNMRDAIRYGNRLIMMNEGRIIFDVEGEAKKSLKVEDLLSKFESEGGASAVNDRMILG